MKTTKPLQTIEQYVMQMWMPTDGDPNGKQVLVDAVEVKHLRSLIEWVIGEDDPGLIKKELFGTYNGKRRMMTRTVTHGANNQRNGLRKEQRKRLTSIMKGNTDGKI